MNRTYILLASLASISMSFLACSHEGVRVILENSLSQVQAVTVDATLNDEPLSIDPRPVSVEQGEFVLRLPGQSRGQLKLRLNGQSSTEKDTPCYLAEGEAEAPIDLRSYQPPEVYISLRPVEHQCRVTLRFHGNHEAAVRPTAFTCNSPNDSLILDCKGFLKPGESLPLKANDKSKLSALSGCTQTMDGCTVDAAMTEVARTAEVRVWKNDLSAEWTLRGIWARNDHDIWAVGEGPSKAGAIAHFDGRSWAPVEHKLASLLPLNAICGDAQKGSKDLWVVGNGGTIVSGDGTNWKKEIYSPNNLNGIYCVDKNTTWAVGDALTILKRDSSSWTTSIIASGVSMSNLSAISAGEKMGAPIAVGQGYVLNWDSILSSWSRRIDQPNIEFRSVWGSDESFWIAGHQGKVPRIWNYDSAPTAEGLPPGSTESVTSLSGTDPKNLWAIGSSSMEGEQVVLQRQDGEAKWVQAVSAQGILVVHALAAGKQEVWASGSKGVVIHVRSRVIARP